MFQNLPNSTDEFLALSWEEVQPFFESLVNQTIDTGNVSEWLAEWTSLHDLFEESFNRLRVKTTQDTSDEQATERFIAYQDTIFTPALAAEQSLRAKLLDSGLEPAGMQNPLRKMRVEAEIFREENLPLLSEDRKLGLTYNKIIGAQTIEWEGKEITLQQLRPVYYQSDREKRERAWRTAAHRQLADREAINNLWRQELEIRQQLAHNVGMTDFRAYQWQQLDRLDYTPHDCETFRASIEQVAVSAATRVYEKHRQLLGVEKLRPWDLDLDLYPIERPTLPSYGSGKDLIEITGRIFDQVDPQLGKYFKTMVQQNQLDVENRKGKAPGAYCTYFAVSQRPFIFANSVGLFSDVRTMLHESGHAFHLFEIMALPYVQQRRSGLEFAEVASMSMELLASPYWAKDQGGFYESGEARRARVAHLERLLTFWPYMAVVDAFQHWVYTHLAEALDPSNCDAKWLELWRQFIPGVDWSGLEDAAETGWHRKQHIHRIPFYYVEYGVAQLGSVQIWRNALQDQAQAVADYRKALAMGGTASLPDLYAAAGAKFAFDAKTLGEAVSLIEQVIAELED